MPNTNRICRVTGEECIALSILGDKADTLKREGEREQVAARDHDGLVIETMGAFARTKTRTGEAMLGLVEVAIDECYSPYGACGALTVAESVVRVASPVVNETSNVG